MWQWYACAVCVTSGGAWARTGAHQTPPSSCELQQPGLLWLRSFFFCQSSFFGRHHDQALYVYQTPQVLIQMWRISWCGGAILLLKVVKSRGLSCRVSPQNGVEHHMTPTVEGVTGARKVEGNCGTSSGVVEARAIIAIRTTRTILGFSLHSKWPDKVSGSTRPSGPSLSV